MSKKIDLTKTLIPNADGPDQALDNYSLKSGNVEILFRDLDKALINEINNSQIVLGCVAWLTHFEVLKALKQKDVAIVVQKEDFLRPDTGADFGNWKARLRYAYDQLKFSHLRYYLPGVGGGLSTASNPKVEAVRCVGNHNIEKSPAFPRMHNKFFVFCDFVTNPALPEEHIEYHGIKPRKVWTGSFNVTDNATRSFENAVLIDDPLVAEAYAKEFSQIFALSEGLDWTDTWIAPEFRIGT